MIRSPGHSSFPGGFGLDELVHWSCGNKHKHWWGRGTLPRATRHHSGRLPFLPFALCFQIPISLLLISFCLVLIIACEAGGFWSFEKYLLSTYYMLYPRETGCLGRVLQKQILRRGYDYMPFMEELQELAEG